MPEQGPLGFVRGALSNERPYRVHINPTNPRGRHWLIVMPAFNRSNIEITSVVIASARLFSPTTGDEDAIEATAA